MNKYLKNPAIIIGIISLNFFVMISITNDYMEFKDRNCVVLDKLEQSGGYKSSGRFYLVLKEERGIIFDIIVSPATYSQAKKGQKIIFNLRQMDIKQTVKENIIYVFGSIITFTCAIFFLMGGLISSRHGR